MEKNSCQSASTTQLLEWLESFDVGVPSRAKIEAALLRRPVDEVLNLIQNRVNSGHSSLRFVHIRLLGTLDHVRAVDILLGLAQSGGILDKSNALEALESKQDPRIVPTAKRLLASYPVDYCVPPIDLAVLIGRHADSEGPATLIDMLDDWRWSCAALGKLESLMKDGPACFEEQQLEILAQLPALEMATEVLPGMGLFPESREPVETRELASRILARRRGIA